jgi:CDP-diacylglycerol--serine O-phosphatidyltransferase
MMSYIFKPANLFTAASLFCGVWSVMLSAGADGHEPTAFARAALFIVFAGIFDGLDGRVARMTRTESEFGMQMDSLVDVVSFGVAPGVLLYKWGLDAWGQVGFLIAFLFILCGVFRLARFNLRSVQASQGDGPKKYNEGLPITCAGGMVAALVLHHAHVRATEVSNTISVLAMTLLLAYLMISTVHFRTFKELRLSPVTVALLGSLVATALTIAVVFDITFLLVVLGGAYIGGGLLEEAVIFARHRRADDVYYLQEVPEDDEAEDERPVLG